MLPTPEPPLAPRERLLWETIHQVLLMLLSAVERYMGMERTREPQHVRKAREAMQQERH